MHIILTCITGGLSITLTLFTAFTLGDAPLHSPHAQPEAIRLLNHQLQPITVERCNRILQSWPQEPRAIAQDMLELYGPPAEATLDVMIWHDNGRHFITAVRR